MNTYCKYLLGGILLVGLGSCAGDDPGVEPIKTFPTDKAVINIRILSPEDENGTRADGPSTQYSKGSAEENYVRKLNFYFYDKSGEYVTAKEGVTYEEQTDASTGHLVEEIGKSRIVLTDLLGQNYPSYVVAVINYNTGGTATSDPFKQNLQQVHDAVRTTSPWAVRDNKTTDFVMTSATHENNDPDFWYFATPISEENFALMSENNKPGDLWPAESDDFKAKPVDIYVERLASKVELKFPEEYTLTENKYYDITLPDEYEIDGEKTRLKVRLYGWGVNGTAKKIKYFKGVNDNPKPFITADGWDYNGTNRSYWAKTPGYGENTYPSSFDDVEVKSGIDGLEEDDLAANDEILRYISWETVKNNNFGNGKTVAYINPHTEDGAKINLIGHEIFHGAITEVLIAGQIVDEAGNPLTLYKLSESYYTEEGVINYLLNAAGSHIWKKIDDNKFITIEPSDVTIDYGFDGTFKVKLADATTEWYMDNEGNEKWESTAKVASEINAFVPEKLSNCYKDGMTYYNIPIRHLRPYTPGQEIKTGMFGVVRNHCYVVTVTGVKSLGHSVYRGDEHIIPPSNDTRYMIGSSIRILSWRMVNQTAEL